MILTKEEFKKRLVEMDPWAAQRLEPRNLEDLAASHAWRCAVQEAALVYEEQHQQAILEVAVLKAALKTFQNAPPAQMTYNNKLLDVSPEGMRFLIGEVWKYRGEVATLLPWLDAAAFGANQVREEVSHLTEELREVREDHHKLGAWPSCPVCTKLYAQDLDGAHENARLEGALRAKLYDAVSDFKRSLNPCTCGAAAASRAHVIDCPAKEEK